MRRLARGCFSVIAVIIIIAVILSFGSKSPQPSSSGVNASGSPQPTSIPGLGTRGNPYPLGQPGAIRDGRFQVNGLQRAQSSAVNKMNQFNTKPDAGEEWMLANVTFFCDLATDKTCNTTVMQIELVGDLGNVYHTELIAVLDNKLEGEVFGGGQKTGVVGFIAKSNDKNMLVAVNDLGSRIFFKAE